jgi:hypothetical protein
MCHYHNVFFFCTMAHSYPSLNVVSKSKACGWKQKFKLRKWTENRNSNGTSNVGARIVVKALCYKPEGSGFDTR